MGEVERCAECGFDSDQWDERDTLRTIASGGLRWRWTIEGLDDADLQRRVDGQTWSIAEYTQHIREVAWMMRFLVDVASTKPGSDLGSGVEAAPAGAHRIVDIGTELDRLDEELFALYDDAAKLAPDAWTASVVVGGADREVGWALRHLVHDLSHHLMDIGRIRHRLGHGTPRAVGSLVQVSVSQGGVPKQPILAAEIGWRGVDGDRQAARQHHGRPWQALCLWSAEVIDALRAEGHTVHAGAAGENLTVTGVDWSTIRPGTRLRVGTVLCEVSSYSPPCTKNGQWFADGDSRRIDHELHPGWSRVYATVLEPGRVAPGDPVVVEP
jgi:MOSC domain-containing protein YiiM